MEIRRIEEGGKQVPDELIRSLEGACHGHYGENT